MPIPPISFRSNFNCGKLNAIQLYFIPLIGQTYQKSFEIRSRPAQFIGRAPPHVNYKKQYPSSLLRVTAIKINTSLQSCGMLFPFLVPFPSGWIIKITDAPETYRHFSIPDIRQIWITQSPHNKRINTETLQLFQPIQLSPYVSCDKNRLTFYQKRKTFRNLKQIKAQLLPSAAPFI